MLQIDVGKEGVYNALSCYNGSVQKHTRYQ